MYYGREHVQTMLVVQIVLQTMDLPQTQTYLCVVHLLQINVEYEPKQMLMVIAGAVLMVLKKFAVNMDLFQKLHIHVQYDIA